MCNQAAGCNRCLPSVQDTMQTQLKVIQDDQKKVAARDLPVGARLRQFGETWRVLGTRPKVIRILSVGFCIQPNLTKSPTIISGYVHSLRTSYLTEALHSFLLPHSNTDPVQEASTFSRPGTILPVQSLPLGLSTASKEFTILAKKIKLKTLHKGI